MKPKTEMDEGLYKIMILEARLCLYGWATLGRGLPVESFKKVLKNAMPEWDEMDEIRLTYPDGMTAQECDWQVNAVLKDQKIVDEEFLRYLRRCYKQDGYWWLFGFFPKPRPGRTGDVKLRESVEEYVGRVLWGQRPIDKSSDTAA